MRSIAHHYCRAGLGGFSGGPHELAALSPHSSDQFAADMANLRRYLRRDGRLVRKLLKMNPHDCVLAVTVVVFLCRAVRFGRYTMSIFSYRKHLRFLTHSQRRRWWDQKKRLTPRVQISGAYVPPSVTREFTYVKVG
jgi:hypothetical protein